MSIRLGAPPHSWITGRSPTAEIVEGANELRARTLARAYPATSYFGEEIVVPLVILEASQLHRGPHSSRGLGVGRHGRTCPRTANVRCPPIVKMRTNTSPLQRTSPVCSMRPTSIAPCSGISMADPILGSLRMLRTFWTSDTKCPPWVAKAGTQGRILPWLGPDSLFVVRRCPPGCTVTPSAPAHRLEIDFDEILHSPPESAWRGSSAYRVRYRGDAL